MVGKDGQRSSLIYLFKHPNTIILISGLIITTLIDMRVLFSSTGKREPVIGLTAEPFRIEREVKGLFGIASTLFLIPFCWIVPRWGCFESVLSVIKKKKKNETKTKNKK